MEFIYFIALVFFFFYLPGKFILDFLKYKFEFISEEIFISFICGISFFLLLTYSLSLVNIAYISNVLLIPIAVIQLKREFPRFFKFKFKNSLSTDFFLILIGTLSMVFITVGSGLQVERGMVFFGNNARDGLYHLSLVGNMIHYFPPQHPELANIPLRGYHFFYDFLLALISRFYGVNYIDLVFRYFPIFAAFLYGLSALAISKVLKMSTFSRSVFLFLMYFGGGLEMILKFFWPSSTIYNTGLNPLLVNILNPPLILSISIIFSIFILIFKKNKKSLLVPALIIGILPEIKIYSSILVFGSVGLISVLHYIRFKDSYYLKLIVISGIIAAFVFVPFNFGSGGIFWAPLELYKHFMEEFSQGWAIRITTDSLWRLILLYSVAIFFYFLPTLGIRLLSLVKIKNLFRKSFYTEENIFWIAMVLGSVFLSTFFLQTEDVFNIVQFLWISYIILLIPTAFSASYVVDFFAKRRKFAIIVFSMLLILICTPHLVDIFHSYTTSVYFIEKERVEVANYIKDNIPLQEGLVVFNTEKGRDVYGLPEIAALSLHPTFYESTITSYKVSEQTKRLRKKEVDGMEELVNKCDANANKDLKTIMEKTDNKYILTISSYNCLQGLGNFKLVKSIGQHSIYKLL